MADELGTPARPSARSYDAPTTPMPVYRPPAEAEAAPAPAPPPPSSGNRARVLWTVFAALVTVAAVVFAFSAFSADEPVREVAVLPAADSAPSAPAPARTPLTLPAPPVRKALATYPGAGTPTAGLVDDRRSGIVYAAFAAPWERVEPDPFQFRQRAGQAVIASAPIPGADPGTPKTAAQWRALTARAARWTVARYQPGEATFQWTASQRTRHGTGWLLGYRVAWETGGKRRTAEAVVALMKTRGKPAMLFASVPDSRKELRKDLNVLLETLRPR
ncbi:hypothetical protein GT755_22090 [Herbidospora sp. NEAU-GS84]|uniref:Uncharacterized protein n=1 Tax=Herbidospora solisilvae TaxID=2696284 RepID=A0A7C9NJS2_9ACTN|nr:hypothetical protein [Herbidospora solisilvae]NAS24372.1 hypothetical protein [Herbidospora solisilvae]